MRRARGFSLMELLVSVALAALVLAGAFQLHLSFSRQSRRQRDVAELQQTLRVAMQLVERALRSAGQGLPPTRRLTARVGAGCTAVTYYGFQFSNDNSYSDPKTTFWNPAVADRDPDWFRVVTADDAAVYTGSDGADVELLATAAQRWQPGELFLVTPDVTEPPSACALACAHPYEVTRGFSGTPTPAAPGVIEARHSVGCYDPAPAADGCLAGHGRPGGCAGPGSTLHHFSGRSTVYRVMTPAAQLAMRSAPFGTPSSDAAYKWIPLADGIEDLQVAVILADGSECVDVDDPAACNFADAVAVRITLVGRSAAPLSATRTITSTVQLRNQYAATK